MSEPFIAEIKIFAGNFAPRGYAFCDGQLLQIAQNTALFSLIGTVYGGDGRTTTALPNLQGRFPMHPGRGPGLTARRIGEKVGSESVTLSAAQIPAHTHEWTATGGEATTGTPGATVRYATPTENVYGPRTDPVTMASQTLANAGAGQPHENRQPFLGINFIIALVGIYPPRD